MPSDAISEACLGWSQHRRGWPVSWRIKNEMGMARLADAVTLRRCGDQFVRIGSFALGPRRFVTGSWSGWTVLGGLTKHQNKGWARTTGQSSPTS